MCSLNLDIIVSRHDETKRQYIFSKSVQNQTYNNSRTNITTDSGVENNKSALKEF